MEMSPNAGQGHGILAYVPLLHPRLVIYMLNCTFINEIRIIKSKLYDSIKIAFMAVFQRPFFWSVIWALSDYIN